MEQQRRRLTQDELQRIAELDEQIESSKNEIVMIRVTAGIRSRPANLTETKAVARLIYCYRCTCGASKRPGNVMCDPCFKSLPRGMQNRLRRMLKNSFVVAVLNALHSLGNELQLPEADGNVADQAAAAQSA